ncbi:uncharacterized protein G2W53_027466 [Senna tora]|uniref:Uncharacterized protein n=1 Tax=Senna tora TaxID=362788 RepID=A0A834TJI6_9FABA|nr:uncharacterized protein G2W53_027466 [Senna tora]
MNMGICCLNLHNESHALRLFKSRPIKEALSFASSLELKEFIVELDCKALIDYLNNGDPPWESFALTCEILDMAASFPVSRLCMPSLG